MFKEFENRVFDELNGRFSEFDTDEERYNYLKNVIKSLKPDLPDEDIQKIFKDALDYFPINEYLNDEKVEDIMINNTKNIFVYTSDRGYVNTNKRIDSREELNRLVKKFKLFSTNITNDKIFDVHLPNGSRVNIVDSPLGYDITIRNFKSRPFSILDLINANELTYMLAARLWLYAEGLKVRPANLLIGGLPGAGKSTLLNAMFSFFRPETRIITIEETYELNTETQENCVRLETGPGITMADLVKAALRMRPDLIIIGEVRGEEAKDMLTAMNIGKISMGTIHASNSRDIITRLEHTPMNIDMDIIPLIDALIIVSQVNENGKLVRKVTQVSEISGIETQILLSDLYKYDYKTHKGSDILPSVTYRDTLARLTGLTPTDIVLEEQRRAKILEQLNKLGIRDINGINEFCRSYYDNPKQALIKIDMKDLAQFY